MPDHLPCICSLMVCVQAVFSLLDGQNMQASKNESRQLLEGMQKKLGQQAIAAEQRMLKYVREEVKKEGKRLESVYAAEVCSACPGGCASVPAACRSSRIPPGMRHCAAAIPDALC